jgi:hypothetical protein
MADAETVRQVRQAQRVLLSFGAQAADAHGELSACSRGDAAGAGRALVLQSLHRALVHAARASFLAAALVEEMVGEDTPPHVEVLADLLLRLDDITNEAESARAELRPLHPLTRSW